MTCSLKVKILNSFWSIFMLQNNFSLLFSLSISLSPSSPPPSLPFSFSRRKKNSVCVWIHRSFVNTAEPSKGKMIGTIGITFFPDRCFYLKKDTCYQRSQLTRWWNGTKSSIHLFVIADSTVWQHYWDCCNCSDYLPWAVPVSKAVELHKKSLVQVLVIAGSRCGCTTEC